MRSFVARALIAGVMCAFAGAAHAEELSCDGAYVETQQLRNAGRLRDARDQALICGQEQCTRTIRSDCARWLQELEEAMPSIVVEARDGAGAELGDVRVFIDDRPLATRLDGRAIAIDPGEHHFRFEHGSDVSERRLIIREAEKYRPVRVVFGAPAPLTVPDVTATVSAPSRSVLLAPLPSAPSPSIPVATQVLGGASVILLLTFGALATSGYLSERHLRESCGETRSCRGDDVDSVRTRYLLADVALALGALSAAGAITFWALSPSDAGTAPRASNGWIFGVHGEL